MSHNSFLAKVLRFIGIVLMALTAGLTFLSGIGTACVAFVPTNPSWVEAMGEIAKLQWLYIIYVLAGIAIGIAGIRAVVLLIKGYQNAYRNAITILLLALVVGVTHIITSRLLRGNSMPVDPIVYVTLITLAVFLFFRIPGIWQGVDFSHGKGKDNLTAGGAAAIILSFVTLTIQYMMGATHTLGGINYADAFNISMSLTGIVCLIIGLATFIKAQLWKKNDHLTVPSDKVTLV